MLSNEFKINKVDRYVDMKKINRGYIIVYFYVDDMLILINNNNMIKSTKKILTNKFDIKQFGCCRCYTHSFKTRLDPSSPPGTRTRPGLRKNKKSKKSGNLADSAGWPDYLDDLIRPD